MRWTYGYCGYQQCHWMETWGKVLKHLSDRFYSPHRLFVVQIKMLKLTRESYFKKFCFKKQTNKKQLHLSVWGNQSHFHHSSDYLLTSPLSLLLSSSFLFHSSPISSLKHPGTFQEDLFDEVLQLFIAVLFWRPPLTVVVLAARH